MSTCRYGEARKAAEARGHRLGEFRSGGVEYHSIAHCVVCNRTVVVNKSGGFFGNAIEFPCYTKELVYNPGQIFRAAILKLMEDHRLDVGMCFRLSECAFEGGYPGCENCSSTMPFTKLDPGFRVWTPSLRSLKGFHEAIDGIDLDASAAIDTLVEYARDNKIDLNEMPGAEIEFPEAA